MDFTNLKNPIMQKKSTETLSIIWYLISEKGVDFLYLITKHPQLNMYCHLYKARTGNMHPINTNNSKQKANVIILLIQILNSYTTNTQTKTSLLISYICLRWQLTLIFSSILSLTKSKSDMLQYTHIHPHQ